MLFRTPIVKTKLTFFQKQRERISVYPIILAQYSFSLIPKVLYTIDVVFTFSKHERVVDSLMLKQANIQCVVTAIAIRINHAVRRYFAGDNGYERFAFGV